VRFENPWTVFIQQVNLLDWAVNAGENAMANPVFTDPVRRIRRHFFTQRALD
jgi:hypothetical protein